MVGKFVFIVSFVWFFRVVCLRGDRWSMMIWFNIEAAMSGRSVNRAARMVRGLDPNVGFADRKLYRRP